MNDLIAGWDALGPSVRELAAETPGRALAEVTLLPPVDRPTHVFAAPLNYRTHIDEMLVSRHAPVAQGPSESSATLGFFLKAAGSICGPVDSIELPSLDGREFHHEVELGVVIGTPARGISPHQARDHIFGYTCVLDITLRTEGEFQEERAMRKSFETFTPVGPCIVTADEIADAGNLDLRLWVNDELRQEANTRDLIVGIDELIATASNVVTLCPGDIYATGTPDGVGPIRVGDMVRARVEDVGELLMPVTRRSW